MNWRSMIPTARWQDLVGLAISGVLFWLTIRNSSSDILSIRLTFFELGLLVLSMCSFVLTVLVQSWRMKAYVTIYHPETRKPVAFSSIWIGSFYNAVLPGNVGELFKLRHFSLRNALPFRSAAAYWFAEKFSDGLMMSLVAVMLLQTSLGDTPLHWLLMVPVLAAAASMLIVAFSLSVPRLWKRLFTFIPVKRVAVFLYRVFLEIKHRLFNTDWRVYVIFYGGAWGMAVFNVVNFVLCLKVAGVPQELISVENILLFVVLMSVVMFIPAAPSSAGVVHFGVYSALVVMAQTAGITLDQPLKDTFVLASVVFHLSYFVPEIVMGAFHVVRERRIIFSLREQEVKKPH
jgi:hypothetical protein